MKIGEILDNFHSLLSLFTFFFFERVRWWCFIKFFKIFHGLIDEQYIRDRMRKKSIFMDVEKRQDMRTTQQKVFSMITGEIPVYRLHQCVYYCGDFFWIATCNVQYKRVLIPLKYPPCDSSYSSLQCFEKNHALKTTLLQFFRCNLKSERQRRDGEAEKMRMRGKKEE
jgi:hypothetical protein